ncbi:FecR family protein [Pedobacter steynii]|uniref:Ferric-dicitrate binding protein FerR, regulates iron transport through sigma-19 n=1 Tax=Pedobacter steynii TaxID=430522 RepID=A0A1D7QN56_9SPHI|nr:FecR family protein [Pedobacter steynii]AOM80098.1 hypothetical protein BFS30_24805 [Pedobacter steynii]
MDELKIKELLRVDRPLTEEEQALLEQWYDQFPQHDDLTFSSSIDRERIKTEVKTAVYKGIHLALPKQNNKAVKFRYSRSIAAAAAILILGFGAWMYWSTTRLTGPETEQTAYTTITAPQGLENKLVTLPDRSEVWLMAGTTLKFPHQFAGNKREVELVNGMAFFTVVRNENAPFTVTSGDVRTTVLGTSFNISAYTKSDQVAVSVVTGKVKVAATKRDLGTITPDQQIMYSKTSGESKQQSINAHQLVDWVNGNVMFNNADISEVAEIIEAIYKVKLVYDKGAFSGLQFNFKFSKQLPLKEPLNILRDLSDADYEIQGDRVVIRKIN